MSGYEVVMRIAGTLNMYVTKMFACRVYEDASTRSTRQAFKDNNVDLILSDKNQYDVFALRKLVIKHNIDVAIWPMLPFHMYFLFSFGLARKQIWLSQYLRPDINFKYLDEVVTLGGAGTITEKNSMVNSGRLFRKL